MFKISLQVVKSSMKILVTKIFASDRFKPNAVMALMTGKVTDKGGATAAIFGHSQDRITMTC